MPTPTSARRRTPQARIQLALEALESRVCMSTVAYWRFEEGSAGGSAQGANSILDSSGHHLDGTPVNGPLYQTDVKDNPVPQTGQPNNLSMKFNGVDQRVFVPDDTFFRLTQSLTMEAYIKRTAPQNGWRQILFRGDSRLNLDPYLLGFLDNNLIFQVGDAEGNRASVTFPLRRLNQWFHVAGTLDDASGAMNLYLNGNLVASTSTSIRPFAQLDPTRNPGLGIGSFQGNGDQYFNGYIDEVRLSDEALSPSEFLNAAPSGSPYPGVQPTAFEQVNPIDGAVLKPVAPEGPESSRLTHFESLVFSDGAASQSLQSDATFRSSRGTTSKYFTRHVAATRVTEPASDDLVSCFPNLWVHA